MISKLFAAYQKYCGHFRVIKAYQILQLPASFDFFDPVHKFFNFEACVTGNGDELKVGQSDTYQGLNRKCEKHGPGVRYIGN